jgi:hypothetical protein
LFENCFMKLRAQIQGTKNRRQLIAEEGHVIAVILVLIALCAISISGTLQANASHHRTNYASNLRADRFYETETALHQAVGWIYSNSPNIISAFDQGAFYSYFDRSAAGVGTNDGQYAVSTRLKNNATTNSVILTNNELLGTSSFPNTTASDGSIFNPISSFSSVDFGGMLVKVTLMDGIAEDPADDDGISPTTNFYPIFRVDAMSQVDRGSHIFAYYIGSYAQQAAVGFFGKDAVTMNQDCDGYDSSAGAYSSSVAHATCPIGSMGTVCVKNSTSVYGSVTTTGTINTAGSCGGDICNDMSCATTSTGCQGSSCALPSYPSYDDFSEYCPSNQGNYSVSGSETLTTPGSTPAQSCWATVSIGNGDVLTLTSTTNNYYFETLNISNGEIEVVPDDASGDVVVYVNHLDSTINGNSVLNSASRPSNFKLVYLGTADVKLNGNADFKMQLIAPNAKITVQGNADFYGGIIAKELEFTGSGEIHYDETLSDSQEPILSFTLSQITEYHR